MAIFEKLIEQGMPTSVPPPTGVRLGQIPQGVSNIPPGGIGSLMDMIMARRRARQRIADQRDMQLPPPRMQAGGTVQARTTPELMGIGDRAPGQSAESLFNNLVNTTQATMGGSPAPPSQRLFENLLNTTQGMTSGAAPMSNPFMGGSPIGFNIDPSQIDRIRELIRQRQQQMAPQQPQIDPQAIQARLDEFLANNPTRTSVSLPFGGNIDIQNLRDRMARLAALMGRGMTVQEAMGNQRAAIAQGHDLNNDGIVTDAEYRQSTMPVPTREILTREPPNPIMIEDPMSGMPGSAAAEGTASIQDRIMQLMAATPRV